MPISKVHKVLQRNDYSNDMRIINPCSDLRIMDMFRLCANFVRCFIRR